MQPVPHLLSERLRQTYMLKQHLHDEDRHMTRMTSLEAYAQHGSTSYGEIEPSRLLEIIRGGRPSEAELPRLRQSFMEMPGYKAHDLAAEIGMSHSELEARVTALLGEGLPE